MIDTPSVAPPTLAPSVAEEISERSMLRSHEKLMKLCRAIISEEDGDAMRNDEIVNGVIDMFQRSGSNQTNEMQGR